MPPPPWRKALLSLALTRNGPTYAIMTPERTLGTPFYTINADLAHTSSRVPVEGADVRRLLTDRWTVEEEP
jgi:hypothetical protein